ncbi:MAG TPA: NADH-quinone oxidoreductase subunit M [Nocardioidaceae bacterium]|nr:NADH-quinone oxidoreductase subunit M [Nocardioidaceae bacterium]
MNAFLVAGVIVPLLASVVLALGRWSDTVARGVALVASALTLELLLSAVLAAGPWRHSGMVAEVDVPWVPALGVRMHLGLDGINAPLVVLTAVLGVLACLHSMRPDRESRPGANRPGARPARHLLACVLAVVGGATGTFVALDLIVFFVAFEIVLVPMWLLIAGWGDDRDPAVRRDAAYRFILYTALGSVVMLLGILLVAMRAGTTDITLLAAGAGARLDPTTQTVAAGLLLLGLAVKVPAWPLHTWLPPAHTIAPTVGSVLLAGVLLKMGSYGMVRLVVGVLPEGLHRWGPLLAGLGVVGIIWGALACLVERDLKRLIAFSSVAHMGFVLVGIGSGTPQGVQGALFANIAHGVITSLLFFVVGAIKERHHTSDLAAIGAGLRDRTPRRGWLLALGCIAGLGLPGLAGFWGELLAILGAWDGAAVLGSSGARWTAVLAAVGTALAAAYLLRVLYLVWHGVAEEPPAEVGDADGLEVAVASPLVVGVFAFGLLPWLLLSVTSPAVTNLVGLR